jgi:hypothetical protein
MTKLANATIPVEDAKVEERQVTVRVLTIGTKQVTQALYKQLVERDIIDEKTCELLGTVWGWVNLHDSDCARASHKHVVWEHEGRLLRSRVKASVGENYHYSRLLHNLAYLHDAYIGTLIVEGRWFKEGVTKIYSDIEGLRQYTNMDECYHLTDCQETNRDIDQVSKLGADYDQEIVKTLLERYFSPYELNGILSTKGILSMDSEEKLKKLQGRLTKRNEYSKERILKEFVEKNIGFADREYRDLSKEQMYSNMVKIASEINTTKQNWEKSYQVILDAGQLFIAVSGVWK